MTGWIAVLAFTFLFALVMGGLIRSTMGPSTWLDRQCSDTDEDLDRMYGGWRNRS